MSKTKFTKGEWEVSTCASKVSVWSDNESIINAMTFNYPNDKDKSRVLANAHLIAAAPEMYKAIGNIVKYHKLNDGSVNEYVHNSIYSFDKLLAKARGE